ncbi:MAG: PIG-L deacetylase family protein [Rhodospirillales bacterium]
MDAGPVLVVAPHGLDEVLGCGGTMAIDAAAGRAVHVLILCGDGTGYDDKRREAASATAKLLGAQPPRFAGFPENRSDTVPLGDLIAAIERAVAEVKPATVYVSHGGNLNVDHQNAFRATATALRPVPGGPVRAFYGYEVASSTDWAPPGFGAAFQPQRFVDIAAVLDKKIAALRLYAAELRPEPHARSLAAIENLARARGATAGAKAAEAFSVLRLIDGPNA